MFAAEWNEIRHINSTECKNINAEIDNVGKH